MLQPLNETSRPPRCCAADCAAHPIGMKESPAATRARHAPPREWAIVNVRLPVALVVADDAADHQIRRVVVAAIRHAQQVINRPNRLFAQFTVRQINDRRLIFHLPVGKSVVTAASSLFKTFDWRIIAGGGDDSTCSSDGSNGGIGGGEAVPAIKSFVCPARLSTESFISISFRLTINSIHKFYLLKSCYF